MPGIRAGPSGSSGQSPSVRQPGPIPRAAQRPTLRRAESSLRAAADPSHPDTAAQTPCLRDAHPLPTALSDEVGAYRPDGRLRPAAQPEDRRSRAPLFESPFALEVGSSHKEPLISAARRGTLP